MDQQALAAREDEELLNNFITENRSFILRSASRACGRFITDSDDEWSVGLLAFHEAVVDYDAEKGPFQPFAGLIIRRRVTDYLRKEQRHSPEISVEPGSLSGELPGEEASPLALELRSRSAQLAEESQAARPGTSDTRDEIEAVGQILGGYGFSFFDLADCSPKAGKTKDQCARVIRTLISMPELMGVLRDTGALPVKALCKASGVSKKIPERHRKYIIAAAEILTGDYPILSEYLGFVRKAVN